jgi:hypothetical protein
LMEETPFWKKMPSYRLCPKALDFSDGYHRNHLGKPFHSYFQVAATVLVTCKQYIGDPIDCVVDGVPLSRFILFLRGGGEKKIKI